MNSLIPPICSCLLIIVLTGCGFSPTFSNLSSLDKTHPPERKEQHQKQYNPRHLNHTMMRPKGSKAMLNPEQIISAQVLLISATGRVIDGNTPITSENIDSYRPAEEAVQLVSQYFRSHGFEVSSLVGISFTISASARHFSEFFQTSLIKDETGGIQVMTGSNAPRSDLPLDSLDNTIEGSIISVTFVPPPDFGPTNFSF
jgi:hypothetical protein